MGGIEIVPHAFFLGLIVIYNIGLMTTFVMWQLIHPPLVKRRDLSPVQTHRVTTEGTLSGFQDFFLQPIIKDRPNISLNS